MRVAVGNGMGLVVTEIELSFVADKREQKPLVDDGALRAQIEADNRAGLNELERRRELARQAEPPTAIEATANLNRTEATAALTRVRRLGTPEKVEN